MTTRLMQRTRVYSSVLFFACITNVMYVQRAPTPAAKNARPATTRSTLDIYFIDVEGGQSTLVVTPAGQTLLIDTGFPGDGTFASKAGDPTEARDAQRILAAAHDAQIQRIDFLMLTHYHADHAGGVPELAQLLPIRAFIDHDKPSADVDAAVPGTQAVYDAYIARRGLSRHLSPKPGDKLPLVGVDAFIVSSVGATLTAPIPRARGASLQPNRSCVGSGLPAQEKTENPRSTGVRLQYGAFSFLDVGDLSGPALFALTCPHNLIGNASAYLVAHHAGVDAADPAMFTSIKPRVAIFNNGAKKGGAAETFATLRTMPNIDVWQLHTSLNDGAMNVSDDRIANLDERTNTWLKLSAKADGSFTITNGRTGKTQAYAKQ